MLKIEIVRKKNQNFKIFKVKKLELKKSDLLGKKLKKNEIDFKNHLK